MNCTSGNKRVDERKFLSMQVLQLMKRSESSNAARQDEASASDVPAWGHRLEKKGPLCKAQ